MNLKILKLQVSVCVLLSLILVAEWGYSGFAVNRLQKEPVEEKDESNTLSELPKIAALNTTAAQYSDLVERPLFIEGRRPVVEAVADTVKEVELGQIDDWSLTGVYNKDKRPIALFTKKNETRKFLKIGVDQTISGWVLKEIQPDRVILQQGAQQKSVLLRKPRANTNTNKPPAPSGKPGLPARAAKPPVPATNTNPENANNDIEKN